MSEVRWVKLWNLCFWSFLLHRYQHLQTLNSSKFMDFRGAVKSFFFTKVYFKNAEEMTDLEVTLRWFSYVGLLKMFSTYVRMAMYAKASHEILDNTLTPQCDDWWVCAVGVVNFQPPPCRTAHSTIGPFPMHAIKSDWVEAKSSPSPTQQALQTIGYLVTSKYLLATRCFFFSKNTKYSKKRFDREQW